jgi:hypothetical protein
VSALDIWEDVPLYVKYGDVNVILDIVPLKPLPDKSFIVVPVPG